MISRQTVCLILYGSLDRLCGGAHAGPANIIVHPPGGDSGKEPAANAGDRRDVRSWVGEIPRRRA